jgi:hypothetical protein
LQLPGQALAAAAYNAASIAAVWVVPDASTIGRTCDCSASTVALI